MVVILREKNAIYLGTKEPNQNNQNPYLMDVKICIQGKLLTGRLLINGESPGESFCLKQTKKKYNHKV